MISPDCPPAIPPQPPALSVRRKLAEVKWEWWRLSGDDNSHFKVDGMKLFPFMLQLVNAGMKERYFFKRLSEG